MTKDSDFVSLLDSAGAPPRVMWVMCGNTSNARLDADASFRPRLFRTPD